MQPRITKPPRGILLDRSHPFSRGLIGCWLLNEGSGNTLFDLSGNRHTGEFKNMDPQTDWIGGRDGFALDFDGVNDYVEWPSKNSLIPIATNNISLLLWVKLNVNPTGDNGGLVMGLSNSHLYQLGVTDLEKIDFRINRGASSAEVQQGSITVGKWTQLAGTLGGIGDDEMHGYIDGLLVGTATAAGGFTEGSQQLVLGRRALGDSRFINAQFALAMIWNRQLSQADIISMRVNPYQMFKTDISPGILNAVAAAAPVVETVFNSDFNKPYNDDFN